MAQSASLLTRTRSLIGRRFLPLWLAAGWPFVATALCYIGASVVVRANQVPGSQAPLLDTYQSMNIPAKLGVVLVFVATIFLPRDLAVAGVAMVVWAELQGWTMSARLFFSRIGKILLRLTILSLCIGAVCLVASAFFGIPGVLVAASASFVIPVLAVEDAKGLVALKTGINLSLKRYGALVGLYLAVAAVSLFTFFAVGAGFIASGLTEDFPWWVSMIAFWTLFVAFSSVTSMGCAAMTAILLGDVRQTQMEIAATDAA